MYFASTTKEISKMLILSQGPYTHGFIVEFESEEDRGYYLSKDPAHLAFVESIMPILENNKVLDFVPGVF